MNSSAGFKKRNLLRPPSGMLSNQRQFLKIIDISQSQPILVSNIRTQVASIQEQINLVDKDKKIRSGQSSLQKGYILSMRKWLKDSQSMVEKEDEDIKILKHLGVDNYESGFKKLWKLLTHLDLITSKTTQLQIISFLKYDQLFNQLNEDSPYANKMLQKIAKGGFNPSNFHISQLILDRSQQLYSVAADLRRQKSVQNSSKGFSKQTKDETNQLIEQLRGENQKLVTLLEQFEENAKKQQKQLKQQRQLKQQKPQKVEEPISYDKSNPQSLFSQIEGKYKQQLRQLNEKIKVLNNDLANLKVNYGSVETKLKITEQQLKQGEGGGNKIPKTASGSYEEALLEEMNKMKNGFQRKIQRIMDEYTNKQREMRKKQYEYKSQNERIKWEKGLLLKKFEAVSV